MKKVFRHPSTITLIAVILIILILALFGFRITYNPSLDNNWDAISACAAWAAVVVSGLAIYFAIQAPKKIAEEQNRIALFEKRYEVFQLFERCVSFNKALQKSETIDDMRKDCMLLFDELKYEELDFKIVMKKVYIFEHTLHQMEFLFPGISEKDVHELYSSLWKVFMAIIGDENVTECKKDYINTMSEFAHKYHKTIWNELTLTNM